MRALRRPARLLNLLTSLLLGGCYASNVVATDERQVTLEAPPAKTWQPATANALPGFYASSLVEGDVAGALLKAYYFFGQDGAYSGAALIVGEEGPRFMVLEDDGRWTLTEAGLDLADGSGAIEASTATDALRLVTHAGAITFDRVELR